MRIFFVTNNYTPYSGGVISSINAITDNLRLQGHEVFIITLDFLGEHHNDPDYVIRINCPIKFMYRKNHMAIPWRPTHAITQLLQTYKPDIVHVHHPFLLGASALRATRTLNIPCVFTYHTLYEEYAHYIPLPTMLTKPLIRFIVKKFCNSVNGIIAPSNAIKNYLLSQHITTPIQVIPSPLRTIFLTPLTLHSSENPNKHYFELLVVSRFVPEKNIPFVFDIFKNLPNNFSLTLIGYGTDYDKLQRLAFKTLQLSPERVRFIHKPEQHELLNYYRNSDLFLFSSTTDTQGIVIAESMSQGLPVIAIDGPGQRDIIINGTNGFIINNTDQAITKIIEIADNPVLHNHLKTGALTTAQQYQPNTICQQLLTFYRMFI